MKNLFENLRDWWQFSKIRDVWYSLKCRLWKKYWKVTPRYLGKNHWIDRDELLIHYMFEILSDFLEKECSPGNVEWYGEYGHKITVNGVEKYVRDEMQELYDWWHKYWHKERLKIEEELWQEIEKHWPEAFFTKKLINGMNCSVYDPQFKTPEDKVQYELKMKTLNEWEEQNEKILTEILHRLINIKDYMWT